MNVTCPLRRLPRTFGLFAAVAFSAFTTAGHTPAGEPVRWDAGLARIDVTPTEPVRMAGYGSRDHASEGVDMPLYARALAIRPREAKEQAAIDSTLVLVSVDTIGLPGSFVRDLAATIEEQHGLRREQLVFCSTHTHAGPDLISELSNIFAKPLSEEETAAGLRYKQQLREGILAAVTTSLDDLAPAKLAYGVGEADFAANRRVLTNGRWSGFGVQPDGPVDHTVPVLRVSDPDGKIRGLAFNYACHCTTLGGNHYRINGDWAGYACMRLEAKHPGAVALCTIGCGADANPNPRDSLDAAKLHGAVLAEEVTRVSSSEMRPIDQPAEANFDYAALSFDLPTPEELREQLADPHVQTARHAQRLLDTYEEHGRLPATYPVPIQSWQFGDQLTMIFLGGEVVVDYALRLKKIFDDPELWVTAYANDVLGYIASERMRAEGGYEVDRSGVYYSLPGPWASGTEDRLINRVEQLVRSGGRAKPKSPDEALRSIKLGDDFRVELVAAEPLVEDPINLAFGDDGRLWVVEMGDYPEGEGGGRIKTLVDRDGDGRYDEATVFLSGLDFPTGVQPWRDGVLISSAPDILFARDTDGDGRADEVEKRYTGFRLANPQHRVSGFTYGLDHSLHLASGDTLDEITSTQSGESVDASGHDVQIWPDSGKLAVTSGRTQYIRSRDDFGRWFGNNNSRPMYHYPIDDAYLRRNDAVSYSGNTQALFDPPVAPPVFPVTEASERFNDLFAANRFTSACSSVVGRCPAYRVDGQEVAFVCEPVHNLVHRAVLVPHGSSFRATRAESEQDREFLASSDPWFRPVRAAIGPDGMLWVVDMYREVIEHPEWIPEAWQQRLDLRAGEERGRIYRVIPRDHEESGPVVLRERSTSELLEMLNSPIGPLRDMAQRLIMERDEPGTSNSLQGLASATDRPLARVHALSMLAVRGDLSSDTIAAALDAPQPGVRAVAIRLAESRLDTEAGLLAQVAELAAHPDLSVALPAVLALGESDRDEAAQGLARAAVRPDLDRWLAMAITSSSARHAPVVARGMLDQAARGQTRFSSEASLDLLADLLVTSRAGGADLTAEVRRAMESERLSIGTRLRIAAGIASVIEAAGEGAAGTESWFGPLRDRAWELATDPARPESTRCEALTLIRSGLRDEPQTRQRLVGLLSPSTPVGVQQEAVDCLTASSDAAVDWLADRWESLSDSVRDHAVSRLLSRRSLTERLLGMIESGAIRINDLSPAARQQLLQAPSRSMKVRAARLVRATGSPDREALIRETLDAFPHSGAATASLAAEGRAVFEKNCAVCHVANESGQAIGASLENLTRRDDRGLLEAILDPNRSVDPKYQSYLVQTEDGQIVVGIIESEVGTSVTLAQADGKRLTITRDRIAEMKSTGMSLMPEGFEENLTPQQLHAVVRYLQQPGVAPRAN